MMTNMKMLLPGISRSHLLTATLWSLVRHRTAVTAFLVTHPAQSAFANPNYQHSPGKAAVITPSALQHTSTRTMSTTTSIPKTCHASAATTVDVDTRNDSSSTNPLLMDWSSQPFQLPPFGLLKPSHFQPALEQAMAAHTAELQAIVDDPETSFASVMEAYDRAGRLLDRVGSVFSNLCSSQNTPDLQAVQTTMAPLLSRHRSATFQFAGLFDKIHTVYHQTCDNDKTSLSSEETRLVQRIYRDFVRAGAALPASDQDRLADYSASLATLTTQFTQNVLKDEEEWHMALSLDDLSGCPDFLVQAARTAASDRASGAVSDTTKGDADDTDDDSYIITLSRSLVEPFLTFSDRRDLREKAWQAWVKRGELDPERDNLALAKSILQIRQKVAKIHGYDSFAAYQCADRMAETPERVMELLENVWERAKETAQEERTDMEEFLKESGTELEGGIQPYDWRYYAEKVRKAKYDFDESLLKPYLSLERVTEALFAVSKNLYGLNYVKRSDLEAYHPDVETYEVRETKEDGKDHLVSLFIHDNFARAFKSSGAWMSEYRSQTRNLGEGADPIEGIPIVSNNNNFAKSSDTTLLSYDDAKTLFHEFGHAHHGMLSDATYGRLASTNVLTDWVELPSQLMEHWFDQPEILKKYARHYKTGEPVPDELLAKLQAARSFQQGFQTIEYTACALLDMSLHHKIKDYDNLDIAEFEDLELERLGMPKGIVMRHRPAHFQHLFSTNMYAAGYYVYQWAEVLDADAFAAFTESGNIFDPETARKARKFIYGSGNTVAPDELFRQFRGRDPDITFMLKKKGLIKEGYN